MAAASGSVSFQELTNPTGRVFRVGETPRDILGYGRWVPIMAAWLAMCLAGLLEYTWGALNGSLAKVHHWGPDPARRLARRTRGAAWTATTRQRDAPALNPAGTRGHDPGQNSRDLRKPSAPSPPPGRIHARPARFRAGELVHSRRIREESVATDGCSKRKRFLPTSNQLNRPGVPRR